MKHLAFIALACALAVTASAASPKEKITIDALIVTKAELRRHLAAPEDDPWRPATFADLAASRDVAQPDYLVVRFLATQRGHYWGEVETKIDGAKRGIKLDVTLHFNRGWVEYFIPLDGHGWRSVERNGTGIQPRKGGPTVTVDWNRLYSK